MNEIIEKVKNVVGSRYWDNRPLAGTLGSQIRDVVRLNLIGLSEEAKEELLELALFAEQTMSMKTVFTNSVVDSPVYDQIVNLNQQLSKVINESYADGAASYITVIWTYDTKLKRDNPMIIVTIIDSRLPLEDMVVIAYTPEYWKDANFNNVWGELLSNRSHRLREAMRQ